MKTQEPAMSTDEQVAETTAVDDKEFRSGITWKSLLAVFYSLGVFTPAVIWLSLVTVGVSLGSTVSYCVLLLFAEISSLTGTRLTKQEAVMIFGPAASAGAGGWLWLIYKMWYIKQPLLYVFGINPSEIPIWWAPPATSLAFELRTFFHPEVILPFGLSLITWLMTLCGGLFFALFMRELYIESEQLEFPIQKITVEAIESLSEGKGKRMGIVSIALILSFSYSIILYAVPTFTNAIGYLVPTFPIPWFDYTALIQYQAPGIAFGVATDAIVFIQGFVLSERVIMGMLIGSLIRFVVVNPLLVNQGISMWADKWIPGMDVTAIYQQSNLYFWLSPLIGIGFAVGVVPLLWRGKNIARALRSAFTKKPTIAKTRISGKAPSLLLLVLLFIVGSVLALALDIILAPGFPIWILVIFELVLPFVMGMANGRILGETGQIFDIPQLQNLVIFGGVLQGYDKIDAWFLPLALNPGVGGGTGGGWLGSMKVCQLTKTSISSWIKMTVIAHPLGLIMSFLYVTLFWQIAPIPSSTYPTPQIMWPIWAQTQLVWVTAGQGTSFFDPIMIVSSFASFGGLLAVAHFLSIPFSVTSLAVGLGMPIPLVFTMFLGLIAGKLVTKVFGKIFFEKYRVTIAAGVALGEGIAIVIGVIMALITKSIWANPF